LKLTVALDFSSAPSACQRFGQCFSKS